MPERVTQVSYEAETVELLLSYLGVGQLWLTGVNTFNS